MTAIENLRHVRPNSSATPENGLKTFVPIDSIPALKENESDVLKKSNRFGQPNNPALLEPLIWEEEFVGDPRNIKDINRGFSTLNKVLAGQHFAIERKKGPETNEDIWIWRTTQNNENTNNNNIVNSVQTTARTIHNDLNRFNPTGANRLAGEEPELITEGEIAMEELKRGMQRRLAFVLEDHDRKTRNSSTKSARLGLSYDQSQLLKGSIPEEKKGLILENLASIMSPEERLEKQNDIFNSFGLVLLMNYGGEVWEEADVIRQIQATGITPDLPKDPRYRDTLLLCSTLIRQGYTWDFVQDQLLKHYTDPNYASKHPKPPKEPPSGRRTQQRLGSLPGSKSHKAHWR